MTPASPRGQLRQPTTKLFSGDGSRRELQTQRVLGHFSQPYIRGLEQGRRNPTVIPLYELAIALGVSHVDLAKPNRISRDFARAAQRQ